MTDFKFGSHGLTHILTPGNPKDTQQNKLITLDTCTPGDSLVSQRHHYIGTPWNPKDTKSYPLDTPANNTNL